MAVLVRENMGRETMTYKVTGQIVAAEFADGKPMQCGLDDCECPEHEELPRSAGTYITIKLDADMPVALMRVTVESIENGEEK